MCAVMLAACSGPKIKADYRFTSSHMEMGISKSGSIVEFKDKNSGKNYAVTQPGEQTPLMSLYREADTVYFTPTLFERDGDSGLYSVTFDNGSIASLLIEEKGDYIRMELKGLTPREGINAVVWGPFRTTIDDQIGETVCVVRDDDFAIGLQALDIRTIEGLPHLGDDAGGGFFIDPLEGQEIPEELKSKIGQVSPPINVNETGDLPEYIRMYRGSAAVKTDRGSEMRLFSRDYRTGRDVKGYGGRVQYAAPVEVDFIGTAVALFGCPEPQTLDWIEKIELGEGLPHPIIDGVWLKRWEGQNQAYMLYEGSNIEKIMDYADACGFKLIHIGDFFSSWGHFGLTTGRFPGGAGDIMALNKEAGARGIRLGVHTLTMFTGTSDAYVTPIPSDSLCFSGSSELVKDISAGDNTIEIKDPKYFTFYDQTRTIKIGKELIQYKEVTKTAPYLLTGCVRGQFGTRVSPHKAGDKVEKLVNNDYAGFYPDINLQEQYSKRLAEVCNESGIGLMDFDGFGGGSPTGHGTYGAAKFIDQWYRNLESYRITCGAGTFHYYWHILTFMSWGEPWYDNLRESQVNYRLENQRYFKRNLMPGMLGWFKLEITYRPEDIEWIQARSAGFDAGYLIRIDEGVERNGFKDRHFASITEWQKARRAGAFNQEQIKRLQNPKREFHLEKDGENAWKLSEVTLAGGFEHKFRLVQTGEPLLSKFTFDNPNPQQPVQFYGYIKVGEDKTATVSDIVIDIDGSPITIEGVFTAENKIYCDGNAIHVCDPFWKTIKSFSLDPAHRWNEGGNAIKVSCLFSGEKAPSVEFEFKSLSEPETVK